MGKRVGSPIIYFDPIPPSRDGHGSGFLRGGGVQKSGFIAFLPYNFSKISEKLDLPPHRPPPCAHLWFQSIIDLTIVNEQADKDIQITDWKVRMDFSASDHRYIEFKMGQYDPGTQLSSPKRAGSLLKMKSKIK